MQQHDVERWLERRSVCIHDDQRLGWQLVSTYAADADGYASRCLAARRLAGVLIAHFLLQPVRVQGPAGASELEESRLLCRHGLANPAARWAGLEASRSFRLFATSWLIMAYHMGSFLFFIVVVDNIFKG